MSLLISLLARLLAASWRIRITDLAGVTTHGALALAPVVWVLWHNRLLIVPVLYERLFKHRRSAALISRSKDGELLARVIERFGGVAVRGSSSSGGSSALSESLRKLQDGFDIYITPDGPRGPRYSMGSGAVWLAQSAGASILPLSVEYSSFWRLGRWDGFIVPKPFAQIDITFQELHECESGTESDGAKERERLCAVMMKGTELH